MPSLGGQIHAFLLIVAAGVAAGLFFDGYRVFRSLMRPNRLATAFWDTVFWVVVTPVVFVFMLAGSWGELRLYVLLGLALGVFLYFQVLSPLVLWLLVHTATLVSHVTRWVTMPLLKVLWLISRLRRRKPSRKRSRHGQGNRALTRWFRLGLPRWRPGPRPGPFPWAVFSWRRLR